MEKMIVTEYGRPIMMQKVKEFTQRTMFLAKSDSVFRRKEELESFFLSEWFGLLSGLDGRYFIQKMQEVYYFDR